jgi:hypothetical protein
VIRFNLNRTSREAQAVGHILSKTSLAVIRIIRGGLCLLFFSLAVVPNHYIVVRDGWISRILLFGPPALLLSAALWVAVSRTGRQGFTLLLPVSGWLIIDWIGAMASESPTLGIIRLLYYASTGILVCWIVWRIGSASWFVRALLLAGLAAGIAVSVFGLYEFISGHVPLWDETFAQSNPRYAQFTNEDFGRRILSSVGHPVYLGTFLAMMIPIGVHFGLTGGGFDRTIGWLAAVVMLVGLILTFTRGAYAAALVALFLYLRGHGTRKLVYVVVAFLLVVTMAFSSDAVWQTFASRSTLAQVQRFSTDQRGVAYWQASALMLEAPLLGIGTGHYRFLSRRHRDYNDTPDNMYLRVLAENGVAGLVALLFLFLSIGRQLKEGANRAGDPETKDLLVAIQASTAGFAIDLLTCDALYFPLTRFTIWMLVGVGLSVGEARRANDRTEYAKVSSE